MNNSVTHLDTNTLPWVKQKLPGVYSKVLRKDRKTRGRTALNCIIPSEGMTPPNKPHFHNTYEELLITKGCLSFDSNKWLTPYSYCYHPSGTVHGFKSVVKEETWFISRVGKELDFNFIDKPLEMNPYYIGKKKLDRPWVYHSDILNNVWQKTDNESSFVLSSDPITGACSFLLLAESGWSSDSSNLQLPDIEAKNLSQP